MVFPGLIRFLTKSAGASRIPIDSGANNRHTRPTYMLTLGSFAIIFGAVVGCVWWVCQQDSDNQT